MSLSCGEGALDARSPRRCPRWPAPLNRTADLIQRGQVPASELARHQPERDLQVPSLSFSESRVFVRKLTLKLVATTSLAVTVAAFLGLIVAVPAATGTTAAHKPSTSVLVPVSAAKEAGFTKVVNAPSASTDTSVTGCPDGAQEEFANASGKLGLVSEVLYCESAADATKLLKNFVTNGKAQAGLTPPKGLGSTAVERVGSGSTYLIVWRRGTAFELTGLSTDLSSSSTTSTTTGTTVPLTAHDQQVLANAATQQNARFKSVVVSSGTGGIGGRCEGAGGRKRNFSGCGLSEESLPPR
jgi:hypothetical protein